MPKILYLEDEPDLVEVVKIFLESNGWEIHATTSISDALDLVGKQTFDLVLMDVMMRPTEDMDDEAVAYGRETGLEVARRIKFIKPSQCVVALTVVTDRSLLEQLYKSGVSWILTKPINFDELSDELHRILRK